MNLIYKAYAKSMKPRTVCCYTSASENIQLVMWEGAAPARQRWLGLMGHG